MKRLLRILVACLIVHLWSGVATAQQQCDAADARCKRAKAAWEQVRNQGELENAGARYEPNQPNRGSVVLATPLVGRNARPSSTNSVGPFPPMPIKRSRLGTASRIHWRPIAPHARTTY